MNRRSECFKLKSQSESFRIIQTSNLLFIHKYFKEKGYVYVLQYLWYRYRSDFWMVCYRFSIDYYGMLPYSGNIRRKPRVTRHNPFLGPSHDLTYRSGKSHRSMVVGVAAVTKIFELVRFMAVLVAVIGVYGGPWPRDRGRGCARIDSNY